MNAGSFFIDDEHDWQDVEPGIQRKIVAHTPDLMAVCVKFDLGAVGTPHQHEIHDQIGYVVQGAFEIELDGEKRRLGPGDAFVAPHHTLHGAVALESKSVVIDLFSPRRDDMLTP